MNWKHLLCFLSWPLNLYFIGGQNTERKCLLTKQNWPGYPQVPLGGRDRHRDGNFNLSVLTSLESLVETEAELVFFSKDSILGSETHG